MTDKKSIGEELENLLSPFHAKMQNLIPYHKEVFENYKITVNKLITQGYIKELQKETKEKMEKIKELEAFKQELNNLKTKIPKTSHHILESKFEKHRASINELLQGYSEHMGIVNDILVSNRVPDEKVKPEVEGTSTTSLERFPKTISEFEKYKDEFMKYDALNEFVDDDFLYEVMKELVTGREKPSEINETNQGSQLSESSFSGYKAEANKDMVVNLQSEHSAP